MDKTVSYDQPSPSPTQKVAVGAITGSVTIVLVYLVRTVANVEIPPEVASAITAILSFMASYFTKEKVSAVTIKEIVKEIKK